jgi:hypothetical protein
VINQCPVERPSDWVGFVNGHEKDSELQDLRSAAQRGLVGVRRVGKKTPDPFSLYDENWPNWYAAYMVAQQSGGELP